VAEAEFRYADLLSAGADDTPYRLDLVAQGAQDPAGYASGCGFS